MRRTGGALLVAVGLLAGGCAQSIKDIKVPADFQQVVKDISAGAQPSFSGTTCFSKELDHQDSWRYMADYTVPGSLDAVTKQLRKDGLARGFQPSKADDGKFVMVGKYKDEEVVVGAVAEGQNTKVSAMSEWNCGGGDRVPRHPLNGDGVSANPELEPRQKRLLDGAYNAARDAGRAIQSLLDQDYRAGSKYLLPTPPSLPDSIGIDLRGCDAEGGKARGAQWQTSSNNVVAGYLSSTDDVNVGEQRVLSALGKQWQVVERRQDENPVYGIALTMERKVENVTTRLEVAIRRKENHKKQQALDIGADMRTACVAPTTT